MKYDTWANNAHMNKVTWKTAPSSGDKPPKNTDGGCWKFLCSLKNDKNLFIHLLLPSLQGVTVLFKACKQAANWSSSATRSGEDYSGFCIRGLFRMILSYIYVSNRNSTTNLKRQNRKRVFMLSEGCKKQTTSWAIENWKKLHTKKTEMLDDLNGVKRKCSLSCRKLKEDVY
jgi:hypothetical protein